MAISRFQSTEITKKDRLQVFYSVQVLLGIRTFDGKFQSRQTWSFSEDVFLSQTSTIMKLFLIRSSNDWVRRTGATWQKVEPSMNSSRRLSTTSNKEDEPSVIAIAFREKGRNNDDFYLLSVQQDLNVVSFYKLRTWLKLNWGCWVPQHTFDLATSSHQNMRHTRYGFRMAVSRPDQPENTRKSSCSEDAENNETFLFSVHTGRRTRLAR